MEQIQEVIAKLKENIITHLHPYDLGDMGETETLINKLIESATLPVNGERGQSNPTPQPAPASNAEEWVNSNYGKPRDWQIIEMTEDNYHAALVKAFEAGAAQAAGNVGRWVRITTEETLPKIASNKKIACRWQMSDENGENPKQYHDWFTAEDVAEECQGVDWFEWLDEGQTSGGERGEEAVDPVALLEWIRKSGCQPMYTGYYFKGGDRISSEDLYKLFKEQSKQQ